MPADPEPRIPQTAHDAQNAELSATLIADATLLWFRGEIDSEELRRRVREALHGQHPETVRARVAEALKSLAGEEPPGHVRSHFWPWLADTVIHDGPMIARGIKPRPDARDSRHRWQQGAVSVVAAFERLPDGRDVLHVTVIGCKGPRSSVRYANQVAPCGWAHSFTERGGRQHFVCPMSEALKSVGLAYTGPGLQEDA